MATDKSSKCMTYYLILPPIFQQSNIFGSACITGADVWSSICLQCCWIRTLQAKRARQDQPRGDIFFPQGVWEARRWPVWHTLDSWSYCGRNQSITGACICIWFCCLNQACNKQIFDGELAHCTPCGVPCFQHIMLKCWWSPGYSQTFILATQAHRRDQRGAWLPACSARWGWLEAWSWPVLGWSKMKRETIGCPRPADIAQNPKLSSRGEARADRRGVHHFI